MTSMDAREWEKPFRTPEALSPARSALRVFRASALEPLQGRRGVLLALLGLLPIALMLAARVFGVERGGGILFYIHTLVPFYHYINMVAFIFLGCSALGEALEERTLTYDWIGPLPRGAILAGRYASYAASALLLLLPIQAAAYAVSLSRFGADGIARSLSAFFAVAAATFAAALLYGAFFLLLSLLVKRAVLVAIILAVGVDGFMAYLPLRIASVSPQFHLRNGMAVLSGDDRFRLMI